jgi:hypothetical protein
MRCGSAAWPQKPSPLGDGVSLVWKQAVSHVHPGARAHMQGGFQASGFENTAVLPHSHFDMVIRDNDVNPTRSHVTNSVM